MSRLQLLGKRLHNIELACRAVCAEAHEHAVAEHRARLARVAVVLAQVDADSRHRRSQVHVVVDQDLCAAASRQFHKRAQDGQLLLIASFGPPSRPWLHII